MIIGCLNCFKDACGTAAKLPDVNAVRRHRLIGARIALLAMLVLALLPTVSRAMAAIGGSPAWAEICTPQGMKRVAGDDSQGAPAMADPVGACALCGLGSDGSAPLPQGQAAQPLALRSAEPPPLFLRAARTLHAWRSAQPRGPPGRH